MVDFFFLSERGKKLVRDRALPVASRPLSLFRKQQSRAAARSESLAPRAGSTREGKGACKEESEMKEKTAKHFEEGGFAKKER